jgi:hypothetical protein
MRSIEDVVTRMITGSYELSPRGHKKDNTETMARNFNHKDSFISLDGHEYLRGQDWKDRQLEVLIRDKFACRVCNTWEPPFDVHHILTRGEGGPDDLENLMLLCRKCHNKRHPEKQVRWSGGENGNAA